MSSRKHAAARARNLGNILLGLFLGFLIIATVWAMRSGWVRDSDAVENKFTAIGHMLSQAVAPSETVEVTPSIFDREEAMGSQALLARWDPMVADASRRFHVPEKWIRAVIRMESGGRTVLAGDQPITSDAGALGIMQVMPGTYEEMRQQYGLGGDPFDPRDNIYAGTAYLRWLHGKYGYPAMFAAYNDGPGNLEDHLNKGRKFPAETRNYIAGIARMLGLSKSGKAAMAKFTRPDGSPIWVDSTKVRSLRPVSPGEFDAAVQAVIDIGGRHQAICEDPATATALLRDHGGSV